MADQNAWARMYTDSLKLQLIKSAQSTTTLLSSKQTQKLQKEKQEQMLALGC